MEALEGVLTRYYRPLQAHLRSKFHVSDDQAADWLQEFIHRKVLLAGLLASASKERGRFRTFLLVALDRFVISELRRANAQCRMPEHGVASLERLSAAEMDRLVQADRTSMAPDWVRTVIDETLERMQKECLQGGHKARWGVFRARLLDPLFNGAQPMPYSKLVRRFDFRSPAQAANAFITAQRTFCRLLRQVVKEYAGEGADVEAEIRELQRDLSRRDWA